MCVGIAISSMQTSMFMIYVRRGWGFLVHINIQIGYWRNSIIFIRSQRYWKRMSDTHVLPLHMCLVFTRVWTDEMKPAIVVSNVSFLFRLIPWFDEDNLLSWIMNYKSAVLTSITVDCWCGNWNKFKYNHFFLKMLYQMLYQNLRLRWLYEGESAINFTAWKK